MPNTPLPPLPAPPPHLRPLPVSFTTAAGVRAVPGVAYASTPGFRPLELDLWLPAADGTEPTPAVIFIHGGAWQFGSRQSVGPSFVGLTPGPLERVAAAGIAVASVDYRLSAEAKWPAPLHDVKAALRWLRFRAADLGIDPDRIAVWGESAGGNLAELVGLTENSSALDGDVGFAEPSTDVAAVVAWYAPSDIVGLPGDMGGDPANPESKEALMLGAPITERPDLAAAASPITHVHPEAAPFLLLHGQSDQLIGCVQSARLHHKLSEAGVRVELHEYPGADHAWMGAPDIALDALDRTIAFLNRTLR